jgi:hypothetical protein
MDHFVLILLVMGFLLGAGQAGLIPGTNGIPCAMAASGEDPRCPPTAAEPLGPFYKPKAPERSKVGQGYFLRGTVKSSEDCQPIARAQIEFWLAAPDGRYDDEHRATVFSDTAGAYSFESNFPPQYSVRPPHIHLRVSAAGFNTLVTQHYPVSGHKEGNFDLVLTPAGEGPPKDVK